jgi:hypothetical protein
MDAIRDGDVLVIWKLDRLGRSLKNLIDIVNEFLLRRVGLNPEVRAPWARSLTPAMAAALALDIFLQGADGWNPLK